MPKNALTLRMTDEQTIRAKDYVFRRILQLQNEMEGSEWYANRERYERVAGGDLRDRINGDKPAIFKLKNRTLFIVPSVCKFIEARMCRDLFGSSPWFSVRPEGLNDEVLAGQIGPHSDWKLRQGGVREVYHSAIKRALTLGEAVLLTTWRVEEEVHERMALALTDTATGEAVQSADGGYLFPEDELAEVVGEDGVARQVFARAPEVEFQAAMDEMGQPVEGGGHEWREQMIEERYFIYQGLDVTLCGWKDVLWPVNTPDFQRSDMIAHRRQARLSELKARFAGTMTPEEWEEIENKLKPEGDGAKTKDAGPIEARGEPTVKGDQLDPVVPYAEVYYDFDVFEDGVMRRLFAVVHERSQTIIHHDYRAAMSPRAAKPLHMLSVNRVEGRAYGVGEYEMFEKAAEAADEDLSKIDYNDELRANPPKVWNPHRTVEGSANRNLKLEPGLTLTSNDPRWGPEDILKFCQVPDLGERTWQKMQLRMQLVQAWSGVTNPSQQAVSNMPSLTTATATNALTEVASVLHLHLLAEIKTGLQAQLGYSVELLYFRQDADETYAYLEGKAEAVMALASAEVLRELPMNVEILLTRARRQEDREAALAALPVFTQFYTLPPHVQVKLLPAYVQAASGFGFAHPDRFFPTVEELQAMMQAMAAAEAEAAAAGGPGGAEDAGAGSEPNLQVV